MSMDIWLPSGGGPEVYIDQHGQVYVTETLPMVCKPLTNACGFNPPDDLALRPPAANGLFVRGAGI